MRYVSIDIETTGLNPDTCQVIELGAVISDTVTAALGETFHAYVTHKLYQGEPYALAMHFKTFRRIAKEEQPYTYLPAQLLGWKLRSWLASNGLDGPVTVGGKNFAAFDLQFLKKLDGFAGAFHHRFLDPAMLAMRLNDTQIPDLSVCKERAGWDPTVSHTALDDAIDTAVVINTLLKQRGE